MTGFTVKLCWAAPQGIAMAAQAATAIAAVIPDTGIGRVKGDNIHRVQVAVHMGGRIPIVHVADSARYIHGGASGVYMRRVLALCQGIVTRAGAMAADACQIPCCIPADTAVTAHTVTGSRTFVPRGTGIIPVEEDYITISLRICYRIESIDDAILMQGMIVVIVMAERTIHLIRGVQMMGVLAAYRGIDFHGSRLMAVYCITAEFRAACRREISGFKIATSQQGRQGYRNRNRKRNNNFQYHKIFQVYTVQFPLIPFSAEILKESYFSRYRFHQSIAALRVDSIEKCSSSF
jgi:hypothetical protein